MMAKDDLTRLAERSHPLRASLSEEMHVRKLPRFTPPARVVQIVMLSGERDSDRGLAHVRALATDVGIRIGSDERHVSFRLGRIDFIWERHTEAATYTFIGGPGEGDDPFVPDLLDALPAGWLGALPGLVVRATLITCLGRDTPEPSEEQLRAWFSTEDLVVCDVADGAARIWSDFRLHPDGFGHLLLVDRGLEGGETAQLVQRVQEMGNYRNLALLGLPLAQRLTPEVTKLEARLAHLTAAVSEPVSNDANLLAELSELSAALARLMAETRYRMSASRAYAELSHDRLERLGVRRVRGYQTLTDFIERRLAPATRTCASFSNRLEDLSQRVAWTSSLLRTRVDTALAHQNRDLLASMNRRTGMQLRLQQTVEGLSVVAISYYLIGLIGYGVKALHGLWPDLSTEIMTGALVPPVVLLVWLALRRIRHPFGSK